MSKRILPVLLALVVLLTACGPQGTPTMSPEEVKGTAESSAWTMVALTQLAIPTATPLPPTETPTSTPLPTDTPIPSPTLDPALVVLPTSTTAASGDPCDKPLVSNPDGKMTRLRLQNETGAPVTFSIYLIKTPFGECGYRGYSLSKGERLFIDFPQGCYYFWAIVNDPKKPSNAQGGGPGICSNNNDLWMVRINDEIINLASP